MDEGSVLIRRFQTTVDLWATGVALRRQAFRRQHPGASDAEIERLVMAWLAERPGAEHGDGPQPDSLRLGDGERPAPA